MDNVIVHTDPEILHGTPVFVGTRVPAERLWFSLEAGENLEEFLEGFPSVKREQALGLLRQARKLLSGPTVVAEVSLEGSPPSS